MLRRQLAKALGSVVVQDGAAPYPNQSPTPECPAIKAAACHRPLPRLVSEKLNDVRVVTSVTVVTTEPASDGEVPPGSGARAGSGEPSVDDGDSGDSGDTNENWQAFHAVRVRTPSPPSSAETVAAVTRRLVPGACFAWVARLQFMPAPEYFGAWRWRGLQLDAAVLLEECGYALHRLGWSTLDLFGIHPAEPATAVRYLGLAVCLNGGRLVTSKSTASQFSARAGRS